MEKITSLLPKLRASAAGIPHLQHLTFVQGEMFHWNHNACVITYNPNTPEAVTHLLHEYGHALLDHSGYERDVQLLRMEVDAWQQAQQTASQLDIHLNPDTAEEAIDSYRDWLHARSTCPDCHATGVQKDFNHYTCLACHRTWRVNQARHHHLRRYRQ